MEYDVVTEVIEDCNTAEINEAIDISEENEVTDVAQMTEAAETPKTVEATEIKNLESKATDSCYHHESISEPYRK